MGMKAPRVERGSLTLADLPALMTVREAAKQTRMHKITILRAIRRGELKATVPRHGDATTVDKDTLQHLGPSQGYRIEATELQRWYMGEEPKA